MNSVTKADVLAALTRYQEALSLSGIDLEFTLQWGSKTCGNSFRIMIKGGGIAPGTVDGFIGWTKREAAESLWKLALMAEDIVFYQVDSKCTTSKLS